MQINIGREVEVFILSLEAGTRAKVARTLELLEEFGYRLRTPHSKKILDRLFELRISGRQEVRIFYCFYRNQIYLLSGFVKKSQQTPKREIEKAISKIKELDRI